MNITERLRQVLAQRGLTQRELARRLGVSDAAVSNYLSGARSPGLEEVAQLAEALEVSPAYLAGWDEIKSTIRGISATAEALAEAVPGDFAAKQEAFNEFMVAVSQVKKGIEQAAIAIEQANHSISLVLSRLGQISEQRLAQRKVGRKKAQKAQKRGV